MNEVDVVVIGAGTAGLAAYRAAVLRGKRVVLVESGPGGTTCARVGCMPSKLLVAAADAADHARQAGPFGVHADVRVDGRAVMDRVRRERDRFVGFVMDGVSAIPEEHRLHGVARFVSEHEIDAGGKRIHTRATVVATGSSPYVPPAFHDVRDRIVVNDDVFAWTDLPESIAVFGTGVIGLELGQALHRLGVRTRLFGKGGRIGPLTDPVVHEAARTALEAELAIDTDADVRSVSPAEGGGVSVVYAAAGGELQRERFATALVAAGRRPRLAGLGLDTVDGPVDASGLPVVDRETMRWGDTSVFIAGDANAELPLLHEAADEGRIAGDNAALLPVPSPQTRRSPLAIMFSDPQVAIAGASFAELTRAQVPFIVGAIDFRHQGRSRVMRANHGAARLYFHVDTRRLLGAEMAGPRAENIGHLLAWSHQQGLTVDQMLAMPFYHPVVEEGIRTALRDAHGRLSNTTRRREGEKR